MDSPLHRPCLTPAVLRPIRVVVRVVLQGSTALASGGAGGRGVHRPKLVK